MPIYEYYSPDTHKIYSFLARSLSEGTFLPRCPDDPEARMERVISRFAVTGRAKGKSDDTGENTDPRMERVMAEMERDMAGMDEANPDPRALGRMMRRMTEATGEKIPETMEQMIRRLEKGESPEKLEEEFGGELENLGDDFGSEPMEAGERATPRVRRTQPERDPKLYELRDYKQAAAE